MTDAAIWLDERAVESEADRFPSPPAFEFIPFGSVEPIQPEWLIRGLLERNTLACLYGDPGCYKTFLALDWTFRAGTGLDFHGRSVEQVPVAYIAAEGRNGLARRRVAWEVRNRVHTSGHPIFLSSAGAQLCDETNAAAVTRAVDELARSHQSPGLIVVDTLARNFGPGDENSTKDMTRFIAVLDALRAAHEATVLLVHHTGHADKSRARGAMALKAALDSEFQLGCDDQGTVRLHATKMKDASEPDPLAFRVATVELGFEDDEGEAVTSAVLDAIEYESPKKTRKPRGKNQQLALGALIELHSTAQERLEDGGFTNRPRIQIQHWREACIENGLKRQRFNEASKALENAGLIVIDPPYVYPACMHGQTEAAA